MSHYISFVVKLWINDEGIMERGYVQDVAKQNGIYFLTFDKMIDFFEQNVNLTPDNSNILLNGNSSIHTSE